MPSMRRCARNLGGGCWPATSAVPEGSRGVPNPRRRGRREVAGTLEAGPAGRPAASQGARAALCSTGDRALERRAAALNGRGPRSGHAQLPDTPAESAELRPIAAARGYPAMS